MYGQTNSVLTHCGADFRGVVAFHSGFCNGAGQTLNGASPGDGLFRVHSKMGVPLVRMTHPARQREGNSAVIAAGNVLVDIFRASSVQEAQQVSSLTEHIAAANSAHKVWQEAQKRKRQSISAQA